MITSVSWMPKEASKAMADAASKKSGYIPSDMDDDDEEEEMEDEMQLGIAKAVAKSLGETSSKSNGASSSSSKDADEVAKFLKELDMDNYDEEDDEINLFSSAAGELYYPSNEMDPYLNNNTNDNYDSEELDDITIRPTDLLIICTSIEDEISYLYVYVYEESWNGIQNLYIRNDIIIPEAPLCTAWLDCPLKGGNFVAIGSMKSSIDIWDLDVVDKKVQLPCVQLGRKAEQTSDSHTDSVLGLAWNKEFRNIVASGSADKKVKVWDVATGQCKLTMEHHKDNVRRWKLFTCSTVTCVWHGHGTIMLHEYSSLDRMTAL